MTKKGRFFASVALVCFALAMGIGAWKLSRWMNWETSYKGESERVIKRMVKPECLKEAPDE